MLDSQRHLLHKPIVWDATKAHADGIVSYDAQGNAYLKVVSQNDPICVPLDKQYDLTQATIFGLNERLTMAATSPLLDDKGTTLRDLFNEEWETYSEALSNAEDFSFDYGVYAYYPERGDLVRYAPSFWHKVVAVASSSKLISDPAKQLSWQEIRNIFRQTIIGVVGCSVGSNIIHTVMMDMRPDAIKIADKSVYKMENINRVRIDYANMVKSNASKQSVMDLGLDNKADTVAQQLYGIDPFLDVYVYNDGVDPSSVAMFFDGDGVEPPIDMILDEVDDPRIKILLRQEARKRGVPLLMFTDIGSCVQVDILRYDKDTHTPLSYGCDDDVLVREMEALYDEGMDRKKFFEFVDKLIGIQYRQGELEDIIEERCEIPTATMIPQLGSTAATAGGIATEIIARLRLGEDFPSRMIFNKTRFIVEKFIEE